MISGIIVMVVTLVKCNSYVYVEKNAVVGDEAFEEILPTMEERNKTLYVSDPVISSVEEDESMQQEEEEEESDEVHDEYEEEYANEYGDGYTDDEESIPVKKFLYPATKLHIIGKRNAYSTRQLLFREIAVFYHGERVPIESVTSSSSCCQSENVLFDSNTHGSYYCTCPNEEKPEMFIRTQSKFDSVFFYFDGFTPYVSGATVEILDEKNHIMTTSVLDNTHDSIILGRYVHVSSPPHYNNYHHLIFKEIKAFWKNEEVPIAGVLPSSSCCSKPSILFDGDLTSQYFCTCSNDNHPTIDIVFDEIQPFDKIQFYYNGYENHIKGTMVSTFNEKRQIISNEYLDVAYEPEIDFSYLQFIQAMFTM